MKTKLIFYVLFLITFSSCQKGTDLNKLHLINGYFHSEKNELFSGKVFKKYSNGKDSLIAQVDSGLFHGNCIVLYKSGIVKDSIFYEKGTKVSFKSFTETGELLKTPEKQLYEINAKTFIIIKNDTTLFSGIKYYENTYMEDGVKIEYYCETSYIDGVANGIHNEFVNKKLARRAKFKNGKFEGIDQSWYPNGDISELGYYQNGKKHGIWKSYYKGNVLETIGKYSFGEKDSVWNDFYENGKLKSKNGWRDGETVGEFTDYFETGNIKQRGSFNQFGKRDGHWIWYNENGSVKHEENYKNGVLMCKCICCGNLYIQSQGWFACPSYVNPQSWSYYGSDMRGGPFCSSYCAVRCR